MYIGHTWRGVKKPLVDGTMVVVVILPRPRQHCIVITLITQLVAAGGCTHLLSCAMSHGEM